MADAKGKYAVDIEDGQEEEEGIPQWAIFAGIGGLLLVIIIIIIVVVAGGDDEPAAAVTTTPVYTPPAAGSTLTVGGLTATVVDPKAGLAANYNPMADPKGIQQLQSTTVMEASMAAADVAQAEKDLATAARAEYVRSTGIDASLVAVSAKGTVKSRRSLEEGAPTRDLQTAQPVVFVIVFTTYMPVGMKENMDAKGQTGTFVQTLVMNAVAETNTENGGKFSSITIQPSSVTAVGDVLKSDGTAEGMKTIVAVAVKITTSTQAGLDETIAALGTAVVTAIKSGVAPATALTSAVNSVLTPALVKKAKTVTFTEAELKAAGGSITLDPSKTTAVKVVVSTGKTTSDGEGANNSTNATKSTGRKVRRGLSQSDSSYYSQLVDRLVV